MALQTRAQLGIVLADIALDVPVTLPVSIIPITPVIALAQGGLAPERSDRLLLQQAQQVLPRGLTGQGVMLDARLGHGLPHEREFVWYRSAR